MKNFSEAPVFRTGIYIGMYFIRLSTLFGESPFFNHLIDRGNRCVELDEFLYERENNTEAYDFCENVGWLGGESINFDANSTDFVNENNETIVIEPNRTYTWYRTDYVGMVFKVYTLFLRLNCRVKTQVYLVIIAKSFKTKTKIEVIKLKFSN